MKTSFLFFVLIITAFAYFIGLIMETLKRYVFDDKAPAWLNWTVAFVLCGGFGTILFFVFDASEVLSAGVKQSPAIIAAYAVCLYLLQLPVCMAYWKPIFKKFFERKMQ